jgi:hypothetical protein
MPGKAVPAVSASSSTVEAEEVEILEAEAVVISGAYPDSVPTADLVATTSSQPVLATRAPKVRNLFIGNHNHFESFHVDTRVEWFCFETSSFEASSHGLSSRCSIGRREMPRDEQGRRADVGHEQPFDGSDLCCCGRCSSGRGRWNSSRT